MFHAMKALVPATLLGATLAMSGALTACTKVIFKVPSGEITITADDGMTVTAMGLEDVLKKAIKARDAASQRGDKAAVADWNKIIEQILKKKAAELGDVMSEAKATGTLDVAAGDDGGTVYTWIPNP